VQKHWWRVIAGILLIAVGVLLTLAQFQLITIDESWFGMLGLFAGAAIFLALWLGNPREWWPLIPGLIMLSWAASSLMGILGLPEWMGDLVGFAGSALPFLYVFARNRQANWWALIPGGVMGWMAVTTALGGLLGEEWTGFFVLIGIALAFLAAFVVNRRNWWALIPAGVLTLIAISVGPWGAYAQVVWAAGLILAGTGMVLYALLRRY
jgi:hypothetical protein